MYTTFATSNLFCNIHIKRIQRTYKTSETIEIYALQHVFFTVLSDDVEQSGERPFLASRRPRMVPWPRSSHAYAYTAIDGR
jgi:hypothetical protein